MIKGLKPDKYGAIYLIQQLRVDGLISIQPQVIQMARKRNVIGMQRIFLKDSFSFKKSLEVVKKSQPDCVEVLPAMSGKIIKVIKEYVGLNVYCGGLIQSEEQINACIESGATGVTVSNPKLWVK
jgi:glycerol uptake operon antiterminator